MSKRRADTDLNSDNWDREEEPEAAGKFERAPQEVVRGRLIRTAKRRLRSPSHSPGGSDNGEPKKLFSGFTGFGSTKSGANPSSVSEMAKDSFSFLKKSDTPLKSSSTPIDHKPEKGQVHQTYLAKLKGLNEAVLDWIKQHVESNPCCILTPIFKDYDNYLKEIESEKDNSNSNGTKEPSKLATNANFSLSSNKVEEKKEPPAFLFGSKEDKETPASTVGSNTTSEAILVPTLSFGAKDPQGKPSAPLPFFNSGKTPSPLMPSFGLPKAKDKSDSEGLSDKKPFFNFGSSSEKTPALDIKFPRAPPGGSFTFSGINKPAEPTSGKDNDAGDNQDEAPPEPVKAVLEDDAVFTQRVKVFVKKGEEYSDRGVGNLFIKSAPNGRYQAVVRNETSLGNIILNILLSDQQPTQRVGKNNVMIACRPTPADSTPVPVLLRVKTSEDADKLLQTLDKYKKG